MYDNNVHSVKDRIVSISQLYIRSIVRGKAKASVEFEAKLDMSIDENGYARLERIIFWRLQRSGCDHYSDGDIPQPKQLDILQTQRYSHIRSCVRGPKKESNQEERKTAYIDNTDCIEIERGFSLTKRCCGLGLIRTKLDITTRCSIALSILVLNFEKLSRGSLHRFWFLYIIFSMLLTPKLTSLLFCAVYEQWLIRILFLIIVSLTYRIKYCFQTISYVPLILTVLVLNIRKCNIWKRKILRIAFSSFELVPRLYVEYLCTIECPQLIYLNG